MFAVPGWSLSADLLKTQDPSITTKSNAGPSKKRKRRQGGVEVTTNNVADLYEQHVEGRKPKVENAKGREQKTDTDGALKPTKEDKSSRPEASTVKASGPIRKKRNESTRQNIQPVEDGGSSERTPYEKKPEQGVKAVPSTGLQLATTAKVQAAAETQPGPKLTPLQAAMRQKLISARFRHLNQTLYTAPSGETQQLFDTNPTFFEEYHEGFRQQVSTWPENPVDTFVKELLERGKIKDNRKDKRHPSLATDTQTHEKQLHPLPRTSKACTVADLGSGDGSLANQIAKVSKKMDITVLSYDLQSTNPLVTKADISKLPLEDGSVNVAIFCLALMGTNWTDFVDEAFRILHWKGELWIAEIKSRFSRAAPKRVEHSVGKRRKLQAKKPQQEPDGEQLHQQLRVEVDGADSGKQQTDVSAFVQVLHNRGFALHTEDAVDMSNKMFVKLKFIKGVTPTKGKSVKELPVGEERPGMKKSRTKFIDGDNNGDEATVDESSVLKPCLYKVR